MMRGRCTGIEKTRSVAFPVLFLPSAHAALRLNDKKSRIMAEPTNPGYVYAYGWNRFNMAMIGAWPEENENFIAKNRGYGYTFLVFIVIFVPQLASVAFLRDDLNELIGCLVINLPVGISVYKLGLFRYRRKVIGTVLTEMAKDWSIPRTNEELKPMLEKAKYTRFISVMSVTLATAVLFAFSGYRAWSAVYERRLITNETRLAIGFLYPAYYPFDTKELKGFLPTWFAQFITTIFAMIGYSGPDSLMAMMVLHLCGQLAAVRITLANIVDEECIKNPSVYWQKLSSIIQRHEELNRYGELIEGSFNGMLLVEMVVCTITFCFQGFVTLTVCFYCSLINTLIEGLTGDKDFPILQMVFFVIHGFYTILHLFVYCWTGDLLMVESTALARGPYESDWFLLPPDQAKALMMVINRSRIPLQMTAGKFVGFSLELFTSIMKTSMAYLSVLLAMKDE